MFEWFVPSLGRSSVVGIGDAASMCSWTMAWYAGSGRLIAGGRRFTSWWWFCLMCCLHRLILVCRLAEWEWRQTCAVCHGFKMERGGGDEGSRACVRCSDQPSLLPRPRASVGWTGWLVEWCELFYSVAWFLLISGGWGAKLVIVPLILSEDPVGSWTTSAGRLFQMSIIMTHFLLFVY